MAGSGVGRSADQINEEIRRLWATGVLAVEDRGRYHALLVEWAAAKETERRQAGQQLAA
ncbi:hypothetical protein [Streptomyces formicae]|uniref:Uncharacterized protein n=1 Tax=Streptomyces formicae TaxID=1616117 RepID=A0ABY3WM85_9ACTN|nr:hypothetical protein [Streptomyces formicae]UNM13743.1 hypothetical protein J4032_21845 [Streptomyces formicae]